MLLRGVFRQLHWSQFNIYTVKLPKTSSRTYIFQKRVKKKILKSWCRYVRILICFYCLSIVFPSLGKKCLIRPKTFRKIKIRNAWGYKRIGLWTVGIQISKVKNQFKLLCTKKIRHNVFNLSSGGSVTWIVNFLSDVLSSLANPTDHRQCESENKSENEVFVTWPQNRSVIWLLRDDLST